MHYYVLEHIGRLARMPVLDKELDGSNPGSSMLSLSALLLSTQLRNGYQVGTTS